MKTAILKPFAVALLVCGLFSCSKKDVKPIDELSDLTKEVLKKETFQEMKQGQAMLSPQERDILWKTKLDMILSNKREHFTAEQRSIVLELKAFLNAYGMARLLSNPEIGNSFLDEKLPYYSEHFNKEQLNILMESPYLNEGLLISEINWDWMKAFTSPKTTTARNEGSAETMLVAAIETGSCTCIYDMGCPGPGNNCENTGCTVNNSYEMCGLFGTSSCKKRCSGAEPNLNPDPLGGSPY